MMSRHELIAHALAGRLNELGARVAKISPQEFDDSSTFVTEVQRSISVTTRHDLAASTEWFESDADWIGSLRRLALNEASDLRGVASPPVADFLSALQSTVADSERRFQLLTQRYACPRNFSFAAESDIREYVLERLMVQNRARIEKGSIEVAQSDDLLLRLNLVAVHALLTRDLRFLDALNYYYELLPSNWRPRAQHDWLLVSFFAIYARALTAF